MIGFAPALVPLLVTLPLLGAAIALIAGTISARVSPTERPPMP